MSDQQQRVDAHAARVQAELAAARADGSEPSPAPVDRCRPKTRPASAREAPPMPAKPEPSQPSSPSGPVDNPLLVEELERLKEEAHIALVKAALRMVAVAWPKGNVSLRKISLSIMMDGCPAKMPIPLRVTRTIV